MSNPINDKEVYFDCENLSEKELNEMLPYVCPFCGNRYSDPDTYLKCANKCRNTQKQKDEENKAREMEAKKQSRMDEICSLVATLREKEEAFNKDYKDTRYHRGIHKSILPLEVQAMLDILNI